MARRPPQDPSLEARVSGRHRQGVRYWLHWTRGQKLVAAHAVVLALAFPAWLVGGAYLRQRDFALSRAAEAKVSGPPCPQVTRAQAEAGAHKPIKATLYEGVTFGRRIGHMSCRTLRYGQGWGLSTYPVCQFTGPDVLWIKTDRGEWWFAPGPGQPATVGAPHGEAQCVLDSNFTITGEMRR